MRFGRSENVRVRKTRELVTDIRDYNTRRVPDIKSSLAFIYFFGRMVGGEVGKSTQCSCT